MSKTQQLVLTPSQQVVPINGTVYNFSSHIDIVSTTKAPFYVSVIEEKQLVSLDNASIEFKEAKEGAISIDISNDKNTKESWYLILKADKENTVNVKIDLSTISPIETAPSVEPKEKVSFLKKINWKIVGIIVLVIGLIVGGYFYFKSRKTSTPKIKETATLDDVEIQVDLASEDVPDVNDDLMRKISQLPDV